LNLFEIDLSSLSEKEQIQLSVFRAAYSPHGSIPTRAELKAEGRGGYFTETNTLKEIKHQARMLDIMYYDFLEKVERDENGNIPDDDE
jgi:hypothetical protein